MTCQSRRRTSLEHASAVESAAPEPVRIAGIAAADAATARQTVADTRPRAAAEFELAPGS